jgi:hypothetical protein
MRILVCSPRMTMGDGSQLAAVELAATVACSAVDVDRFRALIGRGNVVRQEEYSRSGVEL